MTLCRSQALLRFSRFSLVGATGVIVDTLTLTFLAHLAFSAASTFAAKVCAAELALINNFLWNEFWTFHDLAHSGSAARRMRRFTRFNLICSAGILISASIVTLLNRRWGVNLYLANLFAIGLVTFWNYWLNLNFNWSPRVRMGTSHSSHAGESCKPSAISRPPEPGSSRPLLAIPGALAAFVVLWGLGYLVFYPTDYDDGVYLASARALASGFPLYSQVFFAQTPVSIALLPLGLSWISPTELGARFVLLLFSTLSLIGVSLIAKRLLGWRGIFLAAAFQALQLSRVGALWTCQAEVPALSLALLALGLALNPSRKRMLNLCGVAALFTLAMLSKVWIIPFVVPLLTVPLLSAKPTALRSASILEGLKTVALGIVVGSLVVVWILRYYDVPELYRQAFQFHFDARDVLTYKLSENVDVFLRHLWKFPGVISLSIIGFWQLTSHPRITVWMVCWLAASLLFCLVHTPLFDHHLLLLVPITSLWGATALSRLTRAIRSPFYRILAFGAAGMLLLVDLHGPDGARLELIANHDRHNLQAQDRPDIELIQKLAASNEWVGGDDQALIFRAGRSCPPDLCDTSFVRIHCGYLTTLEAISSARRCKVIVLGNARLDALPRFQEWLDSRFVLVARHGARTIYLKKGSARSSP